MLRPLPLAAACLALAATTAPADEGSRLQGLFCNTEPQIDRALADIAAGVSPARAADLANRDSVVCTHVDRLHYVIAAPVALGDGPMVKYRGSLTGVVVGEALRPVSPPAELFFITPERLAGVAIERRT